MGYIKHFIIIIIIIVIIIINLSRYIIAKCSCFITQMLYDEHVACQKNRVAVLCVYQTVEYTLMTSLMKEKCMEKHLVTGVHNLISFTKRVKR